MKAVEKIKGWYEEHDIEVKAIASVLAVYTYGSAIGYIAGKRVCAGRVNRALDKMFEATPGFKEQYAEALGKAFMTRFMES